jgi:hypothetical protein
MGDFLLGAEAHNSSAFKASLILGVFSDGEGR